MGTDQEERRARLIEALRYQPDESVCQACLDQLYDYVGAQIAEQGYAGEYPQVAFHLDTCPDCAGAYARLYELALAETAGVLPQPEHSPEPDLSFLVSDPAPHQPPTALRARLRAESLAGRLGAALRQVEDHLTFQLSRDLVFLLRPLPATVALRATASGERYNELLFSLEPSDAPDVNLPLVLKAYRDASHPDLCLVEAEVQPPGRTWPDLEGIAVTLIGPGERRRAVTDAWGLAAFEGVPVGVLESLVIEVDLPRTSL